MSDEDIFRIQRVSKRMKSLCTIVMVIMPIFFTSIWINFENLATGFSLLDGIPYQLTNLTWVHLVSGFAVSLVLAGVILYGMYRLRRLFELYSEGHVFTAENASCIRGFALSVTLYAILSPVAGMLLSIILTISNPPGERVVMVTLDQMEFTLIFLGTVLLVISWVMKESTRLADENAQII